MTNRFYINTFQAALGSLAKSASVERQLALLQTACDLIQEELDNLAGIDGVTSLDGFPASFEGAALKYLRVNAAETAVEFVSGARLTIKSIGGTSYTLLPEDAGSLLIFTNASPVTVTVDSGCLAQGEVVCFRQGAAGRVTLAAGSGVTLTSSDSLLSTRKQGAQIAIVSDDGAAQFGVIGDRYSPATDAVVAIVTRSTTQSIPNNTVTMVTFSSAIADTFGMWNIANPTRLTAQVAGYYSVSADVEYPNNVTGVRDVGFRKNGTEYFGASRTLAATGTNVSHVTMSGVIYLAAGDYIEMTVRQDSGGALNINASSTYSPRFSAHLIR